MLNKHLVVMIWIQVYVIVIAVFIYSYHPKLRLYLMGLFQSHWMLKVFSLPAHTTKRVQYLLETVLKYSR